MPVRVQVILEEREKEAFERRAGEEGVSLSRWFREAARARLAARPAPVTTTVKELRRLFAAWDAREKGREPDWEQHLAVMAASRLRGNSGT